MNETEQKPQKQKINKPNAPPPLGCYFSVPKQSLGLKWSSDPTASASLVVKARHTHQHAIARG